MDQFSTDSTGHVAPLKKQRTSLRVSLAYIVVALLWIFASDWALFRFVPDAAHQEMLSMIKGFGFVVVTGLFLYFLLRSWAISRQISVLSEAGRLAGKSVNPHLILGAFFALAATILITSHVVTSEINHMIREDQLGALSAVAELKVGDIENWLEEHWSHINLLAADQGFGDRVYQWLERREQGQRERILARLRVIREIHKYESVRLYDARGKLRLEIGEVHGENPLLSRLVSQARTTGESQISDLYRDEHAPEHVHFDLIAPLTVGDGRRQSTVGVVVLRTYPGHHLFSLIQRWPLKSRSGETLIVRREGDEVLFLNELRHRPDSALNLRLPITALDLPAARAVQGESGEFEGRDYRGVPVFSVMRPINGTSWQLIAKVDREEVLAPTRQAQLVSAAVTLVAITLAGLVVGFSWRQQMRNFALRQRMHEAEKQALSKHFEYLSRNANDIILLADEDFRIIEVNERATEIMDYSRNDIIGSPLVEFRSEAARATAERDYAKIRSEGRARYESVLHRKDGRDFPVEVGAARVEVEGKNYYQFVIRDISERREHENQLVTARDFYIKILNNFPNPIWRADTDGLCDYFNNAWLEFTGRPLEKELGDGWVEGVHPDDLQRCLEIYRQAFAARRPFQMDYRLYHSSGEYRWIADHGKPVIDGDGTFLGYIGSCYDIHDSRLHEERLRALASEVTEQKNRLETILATTPEHVYLHDRNGRYLVANDAALTELGMERERVIGHTWQEIGMIESVLQPFNEQREKVLQQKTPVTGQVRYPMVHGMRDYAYTISPVFDADGSVTATVTTATDITERMRAEQRVERLSRMYATLSQCNQAIVRIRDHSELFREVCRVIVHYSHFRFAWIGWLDRNWNEMSPIAFNDEAIEYLADVRISLEEDKAGRNYPAGKAVLEGRYVISNDLQNDPDAGAWKQRAIRAGIAATASFPIRQQGEIVGTLNVCSAEADYFSDDLVGLLDEMASDIGFALDNYQQAEALRQSESTLRLFFDLPFIGMAVTSPQDKRWVQVNQTLCDMFGYSREELVKRSWAELTHPNDLVEDVASFERVMRGEIDGYKIDKRFIRKDGQIVYATIDVKCIRDRRGNVDFFVATVADITERKHAEERLVAAAQQFQGLVEQSIAGIFIIVDGRFAYVNPRLAEILGCNPADLIGHDAIESVAESDHASVRASLARCLSGEEESQLIAFLGRHRDGSSIDVGAHINRATHAGRPAVIGVVQDISDKKRSEEKIQDYIYRLERGMLSTIKAVSVMSELRDPYTYGHEQRVGDLAGAIAKEMGLDADVAKGLQIAGYVHDLGKIVVPAEILAKPTRLTKAEFELIKAHPQQGYEVLKEIDFPWPVAQVALQHHERLDGSGYPQGLKGDQIVLEARILAVADVVEAMAAHRPYRPSLGIDAALDEIIGNRGVKYDPAAVDACARLFRERDYSFTQVL